MYCMLSLKSPLPSFPILNSRCSRFTVGWVHGFIVNNKANDDWHLRVLLPPSMPSLLSWRKNHRLEKVGECHSTSLIMPSLLILVVAFKVRWRSSIKGLELPIPRLLTDLFRTRPLPYFLCTWQIRWHSNQRKPILTKFGYVMGSYSLLDIDIII